MSTYKAIEKPRPPRDRAVPPSVDLGTGDAKTVEGAQVPRV